MPGPGRIFPKGVSGNPAGRPPGRREADVRALAREHGPMAFRRLLELMQSGN
jgi:Family of unknown function (DUF5681)